MGTPTTFVVLPLALVLSKPSVLLREAMIYFWPRVISSALSLGW